MARNLVRLTLVFLLCAHVSGVQAQQPKIPRIGVVSGTDSSAGSGKLFRQALQDLGYSDGKNILIEYRYTEGSRDRIPGILAELISLKIDLLFLDSSDRDPRC